MTPTNKPNFTLAHIGQLTTTSDPFPNHYPNEDGRAAEVLALRHRIAELEGQLNLMRPEWNAVQEATKDLPGEDVAARVEGLKERLENVASMAGNAQAESEERREQRDAAQAEAKELEKKLNESQSDKVACECQMMDMEKDLREKLAESERSSNQMRDACLMYNHENLDLRTKIAGLEKALFHPSTPTQVSSPSGDVMAKAKKALEFYGAEANHEQRGGGFITGGGYSPGLSSVVERDNGRIAREALQLLTTDSAMNSLVAQAQEHVGYGTSPTTAAIIKSLYRTADAVIQAAILTVDGSWSVPKDVFDALHDAVIQTPIQHYDQIPSSPPVPTSTKTEEASQKITEAGKPITIDHREYSIDRDGDVYILETWGDYPHEFYIKKKDAPLLRDWLNLNFPDLLALTSHPQGGGQ